MRFHKDSENLHQREVTELEVPIDCLLKFDHTFLVWKLIAIAGFQSGIEYTSLIIEIQKYMPWVLYVILNIYLLALCRMQKTWSYF